MIKVIKNHKGFTLIEAVISLGILSIGILAMFSVQALSIRGNANASRVSTQATWGSDEIEQILSDEYAEVKNKLSADTPGGTYKVSRTTNKDKPMNDLMTIDVTVTHVVDGKQLTFQYLKADESSF